MNIILTTDTYEGLYPVYKRRKGDFILRMVIMPIYSSTLYKICYLEGTDLKLQEISLTGFIKPGIEHEDDIFALVNVENISDYLKRKFK